MKNNVWLWVGVAALVIGSVFACFIDIVNDIPALVVAAFGLGAVIVSTWNKSEQKDWKEVTEFDEPALKIWVVLKMLLS